MKRVVEIQTLSEPQNWNQCQSKDKPADQGTRGIKSETLIDNKLWWKGPECQTSVSVVDKSEEEKEEEA